MGFPWLTYKAPSSLYQPGARTPHH